MRFGFKTSPQDTTWDAMLEIWRAADDIAVFESGWTSDHFYSLHGADTGGPRFEGWMTLAALAQATRRLRMGTLVTAIGYRHPAVLANMAATLDVVSGGRLELGVAPSCRCSEAGHMTIREVMVRSSAGQRSAQRAGLSWGAVAEQKGSVHARGPDLEHAGACRGERLGGPGIAGRDRRGRS